MCPIWWSQFLCYLGICVHLFELIIRTKLKKSALTEMPFLIAVQNLVKSSKGSLMWLSLSLFTFLLFHSAKQNFMSNYDAFSRSQDHTVVLSRYFIYFLFYQGFYSKLLLSGEEGLRSQPAALAGEELLGWPHWLYEGFLLFRRTLQYSPWRKPGRGCSLCRSSICTSIHFRIWKVLPLLQWQVKLYPLWKWHWF